MDSSPLTHARRIAGRALRETSRGALALNARVAPWSVAPAGPAADAGPAPPPAAPAPDGPPDYRELWTPEDERHARALILNTEDEETFERTGRDDAARLSAFHGPADTVLDYGCGIGRVARHVAPGCGTLWAVDVSEEMLTMASRRMADRPNMRFARSTGTAVPDVPAGSVDLIYSLLVVQHAEREDAFMILRDFRRMLRPGGTAYITFPNLLSDAYLESFLHYVETRQSGNRARARFYTPQEVERLLPAAGLRITSMEPDENIVVIATPV